MFNPRKGLGDLKKMQEKAKQMQDALKQKQERVAQEKHALLDRIDMLTEQEQERIDVSIVELPPVEYYYYGADGLSHRPF